MTPTPFPWPDGKRCAAAVTFDMDADSLIHIAKPKDSDNRLYPISMGRYGPEAALPRILRTYAELGLKQSFFVPGWCIEQYPRAIEAMLEGGHEVGHHGYLHEDPCAATVDEQGYWLDKALDAFDRVVGQRPLGYRAPLYNISKAAPELLLERGFLYDSSLMGDDVPYVLDTGDKGELIELPVHWGVDDWPPFAHYEEIGYMMPIRSPSSGLAAFFEEFDAAREAGTLWIAVWHPFLTGRLARWREVDHWLRKVREYDDVWFASLADIARHVESVRASGAEVRVDTLPYYERAPAQAARSS